MLEEHRWDLLARHLRDARVHVLDAVEVGEQLRRRLRADPRHAGEVVGAVAAERRQLDVALRRHAEPLLDRGRRHLSDLADALQGVEHGDVLIDELHRITVARDDLDAVAVGDGAGGQRRQHVVRLDTLHLDDRDREHLEDLVEPVDLGAELVRHLVTSGLVVLVRGGALLVLTDVEGDRHRCRSTLGEEAHEHRDEAVDRVRQLALGSPEAVGQREERPVREAVPIEQEQQRSLTGRSSGVRWHRDILGPGRSKGGSGRGDLDDPRPRGAPEGLRTP